MNKIKIEHHGWFWLWLAGWLFTIGFMHLAFWRGVAALVIWPYYLGTFVSGIVR